MTPKERAITALELGIPDKVPTMEIDFQLQEELLGRRLVLGEELGRLRGKEKATALQKNAELYVETASSLDLSAITIHPPAIECNPGYIPPWNYPDMEDHLSVINMVRELAGDTILVAMGIDATYAIPEGPGFEEFLMSFYDFPEERKQEAEKRTTWAIEIMKRMLDAGAEVMYMCSDYCFNDGPFLSPAMFEEFIYPYLEKQTRALKQAGAYVIKHTDGNILPIVDMLLDSGPHAIQSLDPIAGIDIAEMKRICRGKTALMGNVNTASLQTGPLERIEESARYALTHGMPGGGYIFSSCNSIFDGIPLEHYNIMLEVREQNGYYPESERRRPP